MSLYFGLLGLLSYHDSTGYDLTKIFESSLNNFWHAQSSQIYRELKRMEESGWVSSHSIIQEGRPNKRVYSITDTGRNELKKWMADAKLEFENYHNIMQMRIFFGADDPETTLSLLKEYEKQCKKALKTESIAIQQNIENYSSQIHKGKERSKYWNMTLDYGIRQAKATLEWVKSCITQIEKEKMK
jgi:DNA-binding PadR family transcriptional regulator